jgi:hypothetical protein
MHPKEKLKNQSVVQSYCNQEQRKKKETGKADKAWEGNKQIVRRYGWVTAPTGEVT